MLVSPDNSAYVLNEWSLNEWTWGYTCRLMQIYQKYIKFYK